MTNPSISDDELDDYDPFLSADDVILNVHIEGELAKAVYDRAARLGISAESVVRKAIRDMERMEQAEMRLRGASETRPVAMESSVVCDDGSEQKVRLIRDDISFKWARDSFSTGSMTSYNLYTVAMQELRWGARESPRKEAVLRVLRNDYGGGWIPDASVRFPIGKLGWLIESLQRAREVVEDQARQNRQLAVRARRERSSDEVEEHNQQRSVWTEKRGREAWQHAVALASKHKSSAERVGWSNHFKPWEWLGLCERFGYCCPLCGIAEGDLYPETNFQGRARGRVGSVVTLQLHHRRELSNGGNNVIENVLPLCADCHSSAHSELALVLDTTRDWLDNQRKLCAALIPGTLVTRSKDSTQRLYRPPQYGPRQADDTTQGEPPLDLHFPPKWVFGKVVALTEPKPFAEMLAIGGWGSYGSQRRFGLVDGENGAGVWEAAVVQVRWWDDPKQRYKSDDLRRPYPPIDDLQPLDSETAAWLRKHWLRRQDDFAKGLE